MAFKLLSTQDVKSITKSDLGTGFDALFENIVIPAIGKLIASRLGWIDFDKVARTIFITTREKQKTISLPFANLVDTPTPQVWQDTTRPPAYGSDTLLTFNDDYTINKRNGQIKHRLEFSGGDKVIKVTITGGYLQSDGDPNMPEDLKLGAMELAKAVFDRREELGLTSRSLEGGSMSFMAPLTRAKDIWDKFADYHLYPDEYDT